MNVGGFCGLLVLCNCVVFCGCLAVCLTSFFFCLAEGLSQQGSKHKEEVAALHKSISALDREKDALQDEVDQKTEKLVAVQEENSKKVTETNRSHRGYRAFHEE